MAVDPTAAHGAVLAISNGASTPVFSEIKGVHNGPNLGMMNEIITGRHHGSNATTKKVTFQDSEPLTFDIYFDSTDTQHLALQTAFTGKTKKTFKLTLTDTGAQVFDFAGYVSDFKFAAPVDGFNVVSVSIAIDGAISIS